MDLLRQQNTNRRPLCVDLDRTLLKTDSLVETLMGLSSRPQILLRVPFWFLRGRAYAKSMVAPFGDAKVDRLPLNPHVVSYLQKLADQGRTLHLVTASNKIIANKIATRCGFFTGVYASDMIQNLKGKSKADFLSETFKDGFDYLGDSYVDLPVWKAAKSAIVVDPGILIRLFVNKPFDHIIRSTSYKTKIHALVRALRIHQWSKNVLIFVPLILSHLFLSPDLLAKAVLAFLSFSCAASLGYVINDLVDLDSDRQHVQKSSRPFANGDLQIKDGLLLIALLAALSSYFAIKSAGFLALGFVGAYIALSISYTFLFKKYALVDVLLLSILYTYRLVAGAFIVGVSLTTWLVGFSMFIFASLAFMKRAADLTKIENEAQMFNRGYFSRDSLLISILGISLGVQSIQVMAFYIASTHAAELYHAPFLLWPICTILLLWISRAWLITLRGKMNCDPVAFALKDPLSLGCGIAAIACLFAAKLWH